LPGAQGQIEKNVLDVPWVDRVALGDSLGLLAAQQPMRQLATLLLGKEGLGKHIPP